MALGSQEMYDRTLLGGNGWMALIELLVGNVVMDRSRGAVETLLVLVGAKVGMGMIIFGNMWPFIRYHGGVTFPVRTHRRTHTDPHSILCRTHTPATGPTHLHRTRFVLSGRVSGAGVHPAQAPPTRRRRHATTLYGWVDVRVR